MWRSTELPLGIADSARFSAAPPVQIDPGQVLVMVTDGIPEVAATENRPFVHNRLIDVVQSHRNR
jgi:serine phosphatase RsbU (regulator of sigma subunit)